MTKKMEVHKRRREMSFGTDGSAACPSTENSLRATSAIVLWTAEASQVEAMVVFLVCVSFVAMLWELVEVEVCVAEVVEDECKKKDPVCI